MQIQNHRNSPYIEQLEFAFKKHSGFYFLFKFMPGGDLLTHIHMQKQISESNAKIYFCQILLALNNFHQRKIIYGDLKPENVVIDEEGNMNLTDFGQCRCPDKDDDQFLNITLEYTAPEILKGEKRSFESDYWSLGCLLYEMVVGIAPYYNENTELVIYLITKNEIKFPTSDDKALAISNECKEVIQTLLNTNPSNRPGFDAIKNLSWLKEIQWIEFEKKRVLPEWKPANDGKTNP
jgi:serum/glucocorticoid-regulated kinase 2